MTCKIPIFLLGFLTAIFLATRADAFEFGLTEMEGSIRTWRSAEGLPADSVTAIIQTRDGFLWVGTSAGLVRFDGIKFIETKLNASTNSSLWVTALCEDNNGHLWIGTQQHGLFELVAGAVRQYTKKNGLLDDNVTSLAADSKGSVWIGTRSGLNLVSGKEFKSFTVRDGLPDDLVSSVHVARSGTVWITTRGGMGRFLDSKITPYLLATESQGRSPEYLGAYEDRRGNLWAFGDTYLINLAEGKRFNYFRGNEAASVRIWSLCEGRDGRLWIGTSGRGLFCFDDNRFQPVILGELRSPYDVRAICEDREGNLWLGTSGGGLVQMRPQPVHSLRVEQGLPTAVATALALDRHGQLHVGLGRGGLFVGQSGRFERLGSGGSLEAPGFVSSLCVARDGTVWAGTLGGGLYGLRNGRGVQFTTANGLADDSVLSVCADLSGNVWAGTKAGTIHRFDEKTLTRYDASHGLSESPITMIAPAAAGGIWAGTQDGSILRSEKEKFIAVPSKEKDGRHPVIALHEGADGHVWIGTAGGGLSCLIKDVRINWNSRNGLPNDFVGGVVEDSKQNLWLATAAGIFRVSRSSMQKSLADPETPLLCQLISDAKTLYEPSTVFGGARVLLSPEQNLWFATSEGVLNVDTRQPEIESSQLPVYIESVAFNGETPISMLQSSTRSSSGSNSASINVRRDLRSLEIYFTALSFAAPDKVRFRHKLEGFEPDWVDDGPDRFVRYGRLPYGHYQFRVAAQNAGGAWQEATTTFPFEVPTPLYLKPWIIVLYVLAAIALVTGIVRVVSHRRLRFALTQLEQQQSLERERMRIARDMHDEMGSKLTKISFLSERVKVDQSVTGALATKIESIAETSRELLQKMDEIVWVVNPRNDTLENLAAYLSHYAVEYFQNTNIECELKLPRTISNVPLSSEARHNLFLAFEETLNNVLKHSGATLVKIEMVFNAADFEIIIADDGRGFAVPQITAPTTPHRATGGGNGLRNIRQRLADIGGECKISSSAETGTTVSMRIRLNKSSVKKS